MSKLRQRCENKLGCGRMTAHGFVLGLSFLCTQTCLYEHLTGKRVSKPKGGRRRNDEDE